MDRQSMYKYDSLFLSLATAKDKGEKKLFGFAFTPLMRDDGTTLSDDIHELYVYKCDENSTFNNHALYLGLPCCKEDYNGCPNIPSSLIFQRSTKETFSVSTQLSSTKLTQNDILDTLFVVLDDNTEKYGLLVFQSLALEYLFKFIVQSRILYSRATCGMEEEQFRSSIQELFQSIRFVLSLDSRSSETLIFTQDIREISV
ncbi:hypothetical protein llap_19172 [Limosa lapponica baueri]|uniref:C2 DOCK-type domain-containing protein n=1 Tax=Limosa lapponica baueri TaxID=1758121 RepID=A0A2I0T9Q8_LIMLA|nr:hypothetical protein llap_19172 [Limosa lapponica baueri]